MGSTWVATRMIFSRFSMILFNTKTTFSVVRSHNCQATLVFQEKGRGGGGANAPCHSCAPPGYAFPI